MVFTNTNTNTVYCIMAQEYNENPFFLVQFLSTLISNLILQMHHCNVLVI